MPTWAHLWTKNDEGPRKMKREILRRQCQPCSVMGCRRVDAGYKLVGDVFKKQSVKRERLPETTGAALEAEAIDTCI